MMILKFLRTARIQRGHVAALSVAALTLGLATGTVTAVSNSQARHPTYTYVDGSHSFCSDGGLIELSVMLVDPALGFSTAREAADAYVASVKQDGAAGVPSSEMYDLKQPAREFSLPVERKIASNLSYFDNRAADGELLEARITVERIGDRYHVTNTAVCVNQVVSDLETYVRLKEQLAVRSTALDADVIIEEKIGDD